MADLKPCPFCGGKALNFSGSLVTYVHCRSCRAEGPSKHGDDEAADAWNRRAAKREAMERDHGAMEKLRRERISLHATGPYEGVRWVYGANSLATDPADAILGKRG